MNKTPLPALGAPGYAGPPERIFPGNVQRKAQSALGLLGSSALGTERICPAGDDFCKFWSLAARGAMELLLDTPLTTLVFVHDRRAIRGSPAIPPCRESDHNSLQVAALLGEEVFTVLGLLALRPLHDTGTGEPFQAVRQ